MSVRSESAEDPGAAGAEYRAALARALSGLRHGHGWSLRELSERSGLSVPYLSELERGLKAPSPDALESLAAAYGLSLAGLLRAIADQLEPTMAKEVPAAAPPDVLTGLTQEDLAELLRYAAYLRWRRERYRSEPGNPRSTA